MCPCVALAADPVSWPVAAVLGIAWLIYTYLWLVVAVAVITATGFVALVVYLNRQDRKPVVRLGLCPPERGELVRVYARPRPSRIDAPVRITAIRNQVEPAAIEAPWPAYSTEGRARLRELVRRP